MAPGEKGRKPRGAPAQIRSETDNSKKIKEKKMFMALEYWGQYSKDTAFFS